MIKSIMGFVLLFLISINLHATKLTQDNTAIIVIDVWDDKLLDSYVKESLNPFLEEAKKKGYLLINAPSQGKLNKNLNNIFDYTISNLDPVFPILNKHNIKNVVYAGYDKLLCVLDKPAGAFHLKNLGFKYNYFVLNNLSVSLTNEMDKLSNHFFSELDIKKLDSMELINKDYKFLNTNFIHSNFEIKEASLSGANPLVIIFKKEKKDFISIQDKISSMNIPIMEVIKGVSQIDEYKLIEYIKSNHITDIVWGGIMLIQISYFTSWEY